MDFLSNLAKGDKPNSTSDQPNNPDQKPSNSDLFGSAKVVAEAAQAQFSGQSDKYDKAKVAGAAADILDAASEYGKLDEKQGVGKYVDQAENYLRSYNTTSTTTTTPAVPAPAGESGEVKTTTPSEATPTETTEAEKPSGGAGDYVKMAEGFLNKPSGGDGGAGAGEKSATEGEGGYGNMMKMAGDFLKK